MGANKPRDPQNAIPSMMNAKKKIDFLIKGLVTSLRING